MTNRPHKIAAVVVLYNPDDGVVDNISTYINQVDKLFVVDNSENINRDIIKRISAPNIKYIENNTNLGIATALNIGAQNAINENYDYLLTMDQDSKASERMVEVLVDIAATSKDIGIIVGEHVNQDDQPKKVVEFSGEILSTVTSGNLLSLSAYQKVGVFLEELFIDHVDHEYCLRMNMNGYKIIKTTKTFLYHKVGDTQIKKLFFLTFCPSYHPPIRLYYRTRNRFFVDKIYQRKFPTYVRKDLKHFLREITEIVLYEQEVMIKIKMIWKGYKHYRRKILGKYDPTKN